MEGRPETDHANQQIFRLSGTAVPTFCWACSGFAVCNQAAVFLFCTVLSEKRACFLRARVRQRVSLDPGGSNVLSPVVRRCRINVFFVNGFILFTVANWGAFSAAGPTRGGRGVELEN